MPPTHFNLSIPMEAAIKKIGLVGGVGWPATLTYYEGLCRTAQSIMPGGSPPITIESLNMQETLALRGTSNNNESWGRFDSTFRDALIALEQTGCEVAAIASVTPHARFAAITQNVSIPVVSVLDAVAEDAAQHGLASAIVLGTPVTMAGTWFGKALEKFNIECSKLTPQALIDETEQLLKTFFYPGKGFDGRDALLEFCGRSNPDPTATAIILACTDFSAAFPEFAGQPVFKIEGLTFVDAAAAHVHAILKSARAT